MRIFAGLQHKICVHKMRWRDCVLKQKLCFTKMVGCGNDYIYFNCMEQRIENPGELSIRFSDRHFGIGGDGIVLICSSEIADAQMRMFNMDGSEGKMCGNAIRCVCKYLYDNGIVRKKNMNIETASGVREVELLSGGEQTQYIRVNMGKALFSPAQIPVKLKGEKLVAVTVNVGGESQKITCVSMGNPHCVLFCDHVDVMNIGSIGPAIERDPLFPERVNVEFVEMLDRRKLYMRVWERGSGETFACGTGACAAVVAAVENGFCDQNQDITVLLRGGELLIKYTDEAVYLTGTAETIYRGVIEF